MLDRRFAVRAGFVALAALAASACQTTGGSSAKDLPAGDVRASGMGVNIELVETPTTHANLAALAQALAGLVPTSLRGADFTFLDVQSAKARTILGWVHAVSEAQTSSTAAKIGKDASVAPTSRVELPGETYVVTPKLRENPYVQWASGRLVVVTLKDTGRGVVERRLQDAANRLKLLPLLADLRKLGFLVGDVRLTERSLRGFVLCASPAECAKKVEELPRVRAFVREARFLNDHDDAPAADPLAVAP
jgi:hypothetical protein